VLRIRVGHGFRFTPVRQFVLIKARDNYSELQLPSGPRALIRRAMKFREQVRPEDFFCARIGRKSSILATSRPAA
jgi:hypothetical protein